MPSRGRIASTAVIFLGLGLVLFGVYMTQTTRSPRFWPVMFAGLAIGCASAPFYYYFKVKDKLTAKYNDTEIRILDAVGQELAKQKHAKQNDPDGSGH